MTDQQSFDDLGDRQCRRCGSIKPLHEFSASLRASGAVKFGSYCPPCRKAYQHEWYLAHREKALAAAATRRATEKAGRPTEPPPVERRPLREAIGFRPFANPRKQGNAGLGVAIAYLSRIGAQIAIPLTDTQRYDLIIEHDAGLERVQVKTTTTRDARYGHYLVTVQCIGRNNTGTVRRKFDPTDYEWLFVVCGDACCDMIPTGAITARTVFFLTRRYDRYMLTDKESG
jgi:hypothetical protein